MFEILIDNKNKQIGLIENGNLIEYYIDDNQTQRKEGNIYIGILKKIIIGMQAAFVDIGTEKNSFIHFKDLIPKMDEKKESKKEEYNINDIAKINQKVLVQVKKDSNLQKGARVSTHINIPGKYIALMPNTDIITISQKIEDVKEQERLIKLVKENISHGNGAVIRTSAEGKDAKEIAEDIIKLEKQWEDINRKFKNDKENKPKLIQKSSSIVERMILDLPENSIGKIIVNDKKEYEEFIKAKENNKCIANTNIQLEENEEVFNLYDIQKQIEKLENRKIWLKCGGFITIDKTEALTAIDVNTGKYTGTKNLQQTIFRVNKEATIEIAKQLRLRDIGGIIIIDYIDMLDNESKEKIQQLLLDELKKDRTKTQVEGFTKLDLMEMTRKHICSHRE